MITELNWLVWLASGALQPSGAGSNPSRRLFFAAVYEGRKMNMAWPIGERGCALYHYAYYGPPP